MTEECSSGRPPYKERQLRAPIRLCRTKTVLPAKPGMMVTYNHQPSDEPLQLGRNSKARFSQVRDHSHSLLGRHLGVRTKPGADRDRP